MQEIFDRLKQFLTGTWSGEGFARFPTITDTAYTEEWTFRPDDHKPAIHYEQHAWYRNQTQANGQTVFRDAGFIVLKEDAILLVSAQSGGRTETYRLDKWENDRFEFNSLSIGNDPKTIRSQRILWRESKMMHYQLNMNTKEATTFQNHLTAVLGKKQ